MKILKSISRIFKTAKEMWIHDRLNIPYVVTLTAAEAWVRDQNKLGVQLSDGKGGFRDFVLEDVLYK